MALLTASTDPLLLANDIDTSGAGQTYILQNYSVAADKKSATFKLKSKIAGAPDYILTVEGTNLPSNLILVSGSVSKLTFKRAGNPAVLLSWDGQGSTIGVSSLVTAASTGGDAVINILLSGTDTLEASYNPVDISAVAALENVTLTGTAISAKGNGSNNTLLGNAQSNLLEGLGGDDTARGGDGNDTLIGGEGNDRLFGTLLNDLLDGGNGNDGLRGGNGRDTLIGGAGRDELWGDFGRNLFASTKDGESDLLVIKSDQVMFNQLLGSAGNNADGSKVDLIQELDSNDKIYMQGVSTANVIVGAASWTIDGNTTNGIGISVVSGGTTYLEALYVGSNLNADQLRAITTGDASTNVLNNTLEFYGTW